MYPCAALIAPVTLAPTPTLPRCGAYTGWSVDIYILLSLVLWVRVKLTVYFSFKVSGARKIAQL